MSNIDEEAKNNFTIEMRIFENYEKVKHEIIKAIDFLEHRELPWECVIYSIIRITNFGIG